MTVLDDVRAFIVRRSPAPTCDDCIAKGLALFVRQHANHKTRELAKLRGFVRRKDTCATCGSVKEAILFR